jgi:two-component system, sensor histidine kinase PdtaS
MLESNFRALLEAAPDAMIISDKSGTIVLVNSQAELLFQYPRADLVGRSIDVLVPARLRDRHAGNRAGYFKEPHPRAMGSGVELYAVRRDGTQFPAEISLSPLQTDEGMLITSAIRDITDRRRAQQKDLLLTEIHHRVKNNLQLVSSLLKLHAERMHTSEARDAFADVQQRVRTIALLHETLHETRESGTVDFASYGGTLVKSLVRVAVGEVTAAIAIDDVQLSLDQAVPCGLLLNELVTNALKHAFRASGDEPDRPRRLTVEARQDDDTVTLVVSDNGIGFANTPGIDPNREGSLGLHLVRTMVRQLDGTVVFSSDHGARVVITFPSDQPRRVS